MARLFDATSTHPELLAHSHRIVGFLASRSQLARADLELMWSCTSRQHLAHAVFDLLAAVCMELKSDHANFFWQKLASLKVEDWTEKLVGFVGRLSRQSSAWDEASQLLWKLFQDNADGSPSSVDAKVESAAIEKYLEIVTGNGMKPKRAHVLEQLLVFIRERVSVAQHVFILRKMLEELPETGPVAQEPVSRSQFVSLLESKAQVLHVLASEFGAYCNTVLAKVQQSNSADVCGAVFVGRYLHRENLQRRLDLLRVVIAYLPNASTQALKPVIDLIWQRLFELSVTDEEKQMSFNWFTKLVSNIPLDSINWILDTWLCAPAVSDVIARKRWAFACLRTFFFSINARADHKALSLKGASGDDFEVLSFGLVGRIDILWQVICKARDKTLREDVSSVLIKLYTKFPFDVTLSIDALVERRRTMVQLFVDSLMQRLQESLSSLKKSGDVIGDTKNNSTISIDSCTFLLRLFLSQSSAEIKKEDAELTKASAPASAKPAAAAASTIPGLSSRDKDSIQQVVDFTAVSQAVAWAALQRSRGTVEGAINLIFDPSNEVMLAQEASKYETKAEKSVEPASEPVKQAAPTIPTDLAGTYIVDSSEYFSLLFLLLDVDGIDKSVVWEIIHQLPRNTQMETNLRELSAPVQWRRLLDSSSAHRLSYSLKIVDHLMTPTDSTSLEVTQAWCKKFFHTGGFFHLYQLLQEMQVEGIKLKDPHYKACLTLLLAVIEYFVKDQLGNAAVPTAPKRSLALSRTSAELLQKGIDFADFVKSLTNLLVALTYLKSHDSSDVKLVQHTTFLLISSLISRPELLTGFFEFSTRLMLSGLSSSTQGTLVDIETLITDILLRREGIMDEVRRHVASNFATLCQHYSVPPAEDAEEKAEHVDPTMWLLPRLLRRIPKSNDDKVVGTGEHFFWLVVQLLELNPERQEVLWEAAGSSPTEFFSSLLVIVQSRPPEESESHEDKVLIGALRVLSALSKTHPVIKTNLPNLIDELLRLCFVLEPQDVVKCRSRRSRSAAFALLTTLVHGNLASLHRIVAAISPNHLRLDQVVQSWEPPKLADKSLTGYVGMKNLGSTCYMNSVVQQFFMIPQLRRGILGAQVDAPPVDAVSPENLLVLSEMRRMFAYLQESHRQSFDPEAFGKACKLEIGVQQDADEFFNLVTDQVERALLFTPNPRLLKDVFGGKTQNELVCSANPDHVSRSLEEFMTLSVDIENKSELSQALVSFFQGETISNYACERCKYVSLWALPDRSRDVRSFLTLFRHQQKSRCRQARVFGCASKHADHSPQEIPLSHRAAAKGEAPTLCRVPYESQRSPVLQFRSCRSRRLGRQV